MSTLSLLVIRLLLLRLLLRTSNTLYESSNICLIIPVTCGFESYNYHHIIMAQITRMPVKTDQIWHCIWWLELNRPKLVILLQLLLLLLLLLLQCSFVFHSVSTFDACHLWVKGPQNFLTLFWEHLRVITASKSKSLNSLQQYLVIIIRPSCGNSWTSYSSLKTFVWRPPPLWFPVTFPRGRTLEHLQCNSKLREVNLGLKIWTTATWFDVKNTSQFPKSQ